MLSDPEFKKMAETLTGRKLASEIVGASEPDPELLAVGQEQLKKAFLDGATKQVSDWWGRQGADTQNALRGAGVGAGLGAATGLMTGRRRPFRDAVLGGVLGGGLGATAGGLGSNVLRKLHGDPEAKARDGVTVMDRAAKEGTGTLERVERQFPQVSTADDPVTNTAAGWGGLGMVGGGLTSVLGRPKDMGLRRSLFRVPTFAGAGLGGVFGAARESKQLVPGLAKDKVAPEAFTTGAADTSRILTDPALKQRYETIIQQANTGVLPQNTAAKEIKKLYGEQKILQAQTAGMAKGSSVTKRAGTWDDVKAWGSGLGDKAQAYWTLGKDEFNKNPELQRGLYGAGIGAAAGGLMGATNRKRRGVSMLAGMLGGGLLGAGGGVLSSRMGVGGESPPPASDTSPPAADEAAAKPAPSNLGPAVLRNLGATAGTAAGVRYGPSAIRGVADKAFGIGNAGADLGRVNAEMDDTIKRLESMRSGAKTNFHWPIDQPHQTPVQRLGLQLGGASASDYTQIPKGYFDTQSRLGQLGRQAEGLEHADDLYRRRPLLGSTNRLRALGGIAGNLGGGMFGNGLTSLIRPQSAQPGAEK